MAAFPGPDAGIASSDQLVLRAAIAAYLGRYRGRTCLHTESDLRIFLHWCSDQGLDPWPRPGWTSNGTCAGRLRTPADYVRRPTVLAESRTLGLGHLQFEALLTTARLSTNPNDFALVALLGLLGLRIFEACAASINDLGEEHGHRVFRVCGKGGKVVVLVPLPPAVGRAIDRAVSDRAAGPILRNTLAGGWAGTPPPAGSSTWPPPPASGYPECTHTCCGTRSSPPCSTQASAYAPCRSPPARRPPHHDALRPVP
jgi:integrase/recombinase XerD